MKKKKVMFIASTGGHLSELLQLESMFKKYDYSLVTEYTKSNKGLKKKHGKRLHFIIPGTYAGIRGKIIYPFKLLFNCFIELWLLLTIRPNVIISTGAHNAGPMLLMGHIFRKKIIFIETFANSDAPTATGKLVYKFADHFVVQWESMKDVYPDSIYGGWIY